MKITPTFEEYFRCLSCRTKGPKCVFKSKILEAKRPPERPPSLAAIVAPTEMSLV